MSNEERGVEEEMLWQLDEGEKMIYNCRWRAGCRTINN